MYLVNITKTVGVGGALAWNMLTLRQIKRLEQAGGPAGLSSVLAGNRDFSP